MEASSQWDANYKRKKGENFLNGVFGPMGSNDDTPAPARTEDSRLPDT